MTGAELTGAELAETFAGWLNAGRTGVVEWRDERRRRLFYFEDGELVLVQSNLRSESPQRVAEAHPEVKDQALRQLLAEHRVRGALIEATGELSTHVGLAVPERQPVDVLQILWSCADVLPRPAYRGYPRVRAQGMHWLDRLPVPPAVRIALAELDGTRPVEEVVEFAGADPEVVRNALALVVLLGAVDVSAGEAEISQVVTSRPAFRPHSLPAPERPYGDLPRSRIVVPMLLRRELNASAAAPPRDEAGAALPAALPPVSDRAPDGPLAGMPVATAAPAALPPRIAAPALLATDPSGGARVLAGLFDDAPPTIAPPMIDGPSHEVVLPGRKPGLQSLLGPAVDRILTAKDHFAVLGASWIDSPDTLRKQYFQLARDLHPDRWTTAAKEDRESAELLFERVRSAWEVLGVDDSRELYIARVIRGEKTEEEKAQERFRQIIEAEADFKRGLVEFGAGRMLPANELFQRAFMKAPEDQEMRAYAGFTGFRVHAGRNDAKAEEGVQEILAAVKANERLDQGYVFLGLVHWARGNESAARSSFIKALRIRPANPDAVRELKRLQRVMEPDDARRAEAKRGEGKEEAASGDKSGTGGLFSRLFGKKK